MCHCKCKHGPQSTTTGLCDTTVHHLGQATHARLLTPKKVSFRLLQPAFKGLHSGCELSSADHVPQCISSDRLPTDLLMNICSIRVHPASRQDPPTTASCLLQAMEQHFSAARLHCIYIMGAFVCEACTVCMARREKHIKTVEFRPASQTGQQAGRGLAVPWQSGCRWWALALRQD